MIERLIDIIVGVWDELVPVVVVDAYEAGVILRLGKYHKDLKPGLNFKVPFIDSPIGTVVVTTTLHLDPQTIDCPFCPARAGPVRHKTPVDGRLGSPI